MADDGGEDKEQKTEQPSAKRLEEALKRGQVPFSREVLNFAMLFVLALTIAGYMPTMLQKTRNLLVPLIADAHDFPVDHKGVSILFMEMLSGFGGILLLPLGLAAAAAIFAAVMQTGVILSAEPIKPKLEKISIKKGIARMFSMRSLVEFLKGLFKIVIVGWIAWYAIESEMGHMRQLVDSDMFAMLLFLSKLAVKLMTGVVIAMFFIALADFAYQRFEYYKNLRMSKQELKDEYKQQEGDPHIKGKLRQIRAERARKRMMAAVPDADVVITNPTHFAVALKYDNMAMGAPVCIAKGQDNIALTIRKVAEENDVPIVENPPLARALFDSVDIDEEIPIDHYKAVAEVISYVYKMKGKMPKR